MGVHGREPLPLMTLALAFFLAPLAAQSSMTTDLSIEFASAIAARLTPGETVAVAAAQAGDDDVVAAVKRTLALRGFRLTDADSAVTVRIACFENLQDRGCAADVARGASHDAVTTTRPLEPSFHRGPAVSLEMRPVFGQRAQMLDVAQSGDRLFVLEPMNLTLFRQGADGWQRAASQPLGSDRVLPRDVRGLVRIDGARVGVWLPGIYCEAPLDLATIACADQHDAWPIDMPNAGIDSRRNYFSTPEGLPFLGAAVLDRKAGSRWIAALRSGELAFLDDDRRVVAAMASGDDVVALHVPCANESLVLVSSARPERGDTIRAYRASERRLLAQGAPIEWRGDLTALWSDPSHAFVTAVVRSETGDRYDAFQIRAVCDR